MNCGDCEHWSIHGCSEFEADTGEIMHWRTQAEECLNFTAKKVKAK